MNVKIGKKLHSFKAFIVAQIKLFILIFYKIVNAFNEKPLGSTGTCEATRKKKKDLFRRFQRGEHHFSFDGKQRENATIAKELPKPLPDCVQPAFTAVSSPLQSKGNVPNTHFSFPLRFPDVV